MAPPEIIERVVLDICGSIAGGGPTDVHPYSGKTAKKLESLHNYRKL
jgi:hypothetical protein